METTLKQRNVISVYYSTETAYSIGPKTWKTKPCFSQNPQENIVDDCFSPPSSKVSKGILRAGFLNAVTAD